MPRTWRIEPTKDQQEIRCLWEGGTCSITQLALEYNLSIFHIAEILATFSTEMDKLRQELVVLSLLREIKERENRPGIVVERKSITEGVDWLEEYP